ncbi:MAG: squalene/phytoene synthase family protein [candidate division Zixibacteria bacterium]|nr:squalene/phytoene synthase family protein [candidate division Zixibacteria bacterium]
MSIKNKLKIDFASEIDFSQILTNPILDIAARVWDKERYDAFKICYRSMRVIDDLVDNRKAEGPLTDAEREMIKSSINNWLNSFTNKKPIDQFQEDLLTTIDKFNIPFTPWVRMGRAMIYDLYHNGFSSLLSFLRYSEGAAIAPASIFTHLCGVTKIGKKYQIPQYDIRTSARYLALFSYLVHIIRDFQKDRKNGLNYFADFYLQKYSISNNDLDNVASETRVPDNFRQMIAKYFSVTEYYRIKARNKINQLSPIIDNRYQLSLELVYNLYLQIFNKIDPVKGKFTSKELNPTESETQSRINLIINSFQ